MNQARCLLDGVGGSRLFGHEARFADGTLLPQLGTAAGFAGLFVILSLAELFLNAAAFEQLLKAPQGQADRFSLVNTHP
jgi:hypothetical protein